MTDLETELHDNASRPAEHSIDNARIVERSSKDIIEALEYGKEETQTAKSNFGIIFGRFKPGGSV